MFSDWNQSSNGLPSEGQQIEFVLEYRSVALEGRYDHQIFHSHWAEYAVDRVCSWRNRVQECSPAVATRDQAASVLSSTPRHNTRHDPLPAGDMAHAA